PSSLVFRRVIHRARPASSVIDKCDLSEDSRSLAELQAALGRHRPTLPQVFLAGRCLSGADEICRLHEAGELKALIEGTTPSAAFACGIFMMIDSIEEKIH
ncbi:hypothetical protein B296_00025851, partial [Ensete ventricosum]